MTGEGTGDQEYYLFEQNYFDIEGAEDKSNGSVSELSLVNALHAELRLGPTIPLQFARDELRSGAERLFLARNTENSNRLLDLRQITKSAICIDKVKLAARDARAKTERQLPPRPPPLLAGMNPKKRALSEDSDVVVLSSSRLAAHTHRVAGNTNGYCSDEGSGGGSEFVTAKRQMKLDNIKRHGLNSSSNGNNTGNNTGNGSGSNTYKQGGLNRRFTPPVRRNAAEEDEADQSRLTETYFGGNTSGSLASRFQRQRRGLQRNMAPLHGQKKDTTRASNGLQQQQHQNQHQMGSGDEEIDERLKNIEPRMIETIENEILTTTQNVGWDDIAGLKQAKKAVQMAVIYPLLKPELFQGIRAPPKGLLLFGPPGTGKTLIGRCIASQAGATFFNISASSLTSKWIGEGEKMVRALFAVARVRQPTVIFIDEIDSLLTQRTDGEQEATRRIKTEFLVQLDGCGTSTDDRIILLGATNRPHELDEAARRRFPKRLYVPLPDRDGRQTIVRNLLRKQTHDLSEGQLELICDQTDGYSGADMDSLCREAAYGPIRSIADISTASVDDVRPISYDDFAYALRQVRPSVSSKDLEIHIEFNRTYGMSSADA